ncbi:MAG: MiaB/RimO family radical SAM methylthiotransferase [Coriobacteriia bacterium]|nr:MiaB/RimO family radical SAM methylthiotransferase [Coriobacteriia bacterium]
MDEGVPRVPPGGERGDRAVVAVRTLGCKVNQAGGERIAGELARRGVRLSREGEAAVVVVNSCTVTGEADAKVRKAVRRALNAARRPAVVVTGCLARLDAEALASLGERVVVEPDPEAVALRVLELLGLPEDLRGASPSRAPAGGGAPSPFRTRALVKVQEGCDARCAYCIVPDARGGPRSEPFERVVAEVAALSAAGVAEVVLTGTNVGRFDGPGGLPALLREVAATGVGRIRLSSIEPLDLTDAFLEAASSVGAFVPHLHVPLQSGSDRVLAAMRRGYSARTFAQRVAAARDAIPRLAVTTDALVGFPGETAEEFAGTVALAEEVGFASMHVFRYSPRPGTPAAVMPGRMSAEEVARRSRVLRRTSEGLSRAYRAARLGGCADVLVETLSPPEAEGTSEDYLKVRFSLEEAQAGEVVRVRLTALSGCGMTAEVFPAPDPGRDRPGRGRRDPLRAGKEQPEW